MRASNKRDWYAEFNELNYVVSYVPAQILMNAHNGNYRLQEIISSTKNKAIADLSVTALNMCKLYEESYRRVGSSDFCDLDKSGLTYDYAMLER